MKRIAVTCLLGMGFIPFAFSQNEIRAREGRFLKRIEHNLYLNEYNLEGKGDMEKRFFGNFNARLEFFNDPLDKNVSGFRIVKKGSSYIIEVKYISNYNEVEKMFEDKLKSAWASRNRDEERKIKEEKDKLHKIATRSVPISNHFADELYEKMVSLIKNFEATPVDDLEIVPTYRGGDPVTFRVIIKAELWSLYIPWTRDDVRKMAKLCREIINDIRANKFVESKYIYELSTIEG